MRARSFGGPSAFQTIGRPGGLELQPIRLLVQSVASGSAGAVTLTAPVDGWYRIGLIGPGGGGAANGVNFSSAPAPGGGSGGGLLSPRVFLTAGQTISPNLGAPGVGRSSNSADGFNPGGNAGATTCTLPDGTVLTAGGGGGGGAATSSTLGGLGGTASGGEFNWPGFPGGNAQNNAAFPGDSETVLVPSGNFIFPAGLGAYSSGASAGGGGSPPSLGGLILPAVGANGSISATPATPLNGGGGGGRSAKNSTVTSGRGGPSAAYLFRDLA